MIKTNNKMKRMSIMEEKEKKRLFVDIDGTLAEWRKISLEIESEEDRFEVMSKMNEILLKPGYFTTLKPHENVIEAVFLLSKKYEVFVISCVIPKDGEPNPVSEKNDWLDHHVSFVDEDHRIFVPDGENKMNYIPGGIRIGDALLDDYSKNLKDASRAGMTGIKLLNNVNENKGAWYGPGVSMDYLPENIAKGIELVMENKELVRHEAPKKTTDAFLSIDKNTDIDSIDFEKDLF